MANGNKARYASPDKALLELNFFIATLPRKLKEKIRPPQDQVMDYATKYAKIPLQPKYNGGLPGIFKEKEDIPDKDSTTMYFHARNQDFTINKKQS